MARTGRYLFVAIGAIVVIAVITIGWLLSNLDRIVAEAVETIGTETLGTAVTLDSAEVQLSEATAALNGLTIANPAGYSEPYAFELGGISVTIDPESVTGNEIVLPLIVVDRARLTFEQTGATSNLQTLLDSVSSDSQATASETGETSGEELKFVISEFVLADAGMTVIHDQLDEPISFVLPDLVLTNIGRAGAAVTAEEAARQILEPILSKAEDAAVDRAKDELEARGRDELDKQKDRATDKAVRKLLGN